MSNELSSAKTSVLASDVLNYLKTEFDPNIAEVNFVAGGETSQALSFSSMGRDYIVRVNGDKEGFLKDEYAYKHFASSTLPIPEIIHIGKLNEHLYVCISVKAEGSVIAHTPTHTHASTTDLMQEVLAVLDAVHDVPVKEEGYGWFLGNGKGVYPSWPDEVLATENSEWIDWELAYKNGLEKDAVQHLVQQIKALAPQLPNERKLVHGDFGMDNALTDGRKITAVIDWAAARYGDPLYDVAWLHVWWQAVPFTDIYKKHAQETGKEFLHYKERLKCYASCIGLVSLAFFAQSEQMTKYTWLKKRLQELNVL